MAWGSLGLRPTSIWCEDHNEECVEGGACVCIYIYIDISFRHLYVHLSQSVLIRNHALESAKGLTGTAEST